MREYHDTYRGCADSLPLLPFECDGVMAVRKDSMTCLKLKPIRSLELLVAGPAGEGTGVCELVTREGMCMYTCNAGIFPTGSVVELRIRVGRRDDTMEVMG